MPITDAWRSLTYAPHINSGWEGTHSRSNRDGRVRGSRRSYQLVEITDGTWTRTDGSQRCGPGTCLLLQPGDANLWQTSSTGAEQALSFGVCHLIDQPRASVVWGVELPQVLDEAMTRRVHQSFGPMLSLWWLGPGQRLRADAMLATLLVDLLDLVEPLNEIPMPVAKPEAVVDARIHRAEELVRSRLKDWRTADMAAAVGMDRSAFSRLYQRERGEAPGAFLDRARMSFAESVLASAEPNIDYITASIGFASASGFARWFRRHHDCSPLEWHRRSRGQ